MSDLQSYIQKRLARDSEFAEGFAEGYEEFKLGVLLRHAREMAGLSQADIAHRIGTPTSTIIQIESHAENVRLSLLRQYAEALGKNLYITLG